MRHISIVLALSLLFVATASGQQTKSDVGIDTVVNCTIAKNNYVPLFTSAAPPNIVICNSVIYQANGAIGIGTTTPAAALDVAGNINTSTNYQIGESTVLSIGSASEFNLFVGVGAGANTASGGGTYGTYDTFSGYMAGYSNTTGTSNTFSGANAGLSNTTGGQNTFNGGGAGQDNTTGSYNTLVGYEAGSNNTTGPNNTFVGYQAGYASVTGDRNTYVGAGAGTNNTAYFNTFGYQAGVNNTGGNANVYIANPGLGSSTESNTIRIGVNNFQTAAYIAGIASVTRDPNTKEAIAVIFTYTYEDGRVIRSIRMLRVGNIIYNAFLRNC